MNRSRVIVLGLAALAAGLAAFLARGFLGGGTQPGKALPVAVSTVGVLVASSNIEPGRAVTPDMVHWQTWPKSTVDSTFLTQDANPNSDQIVKGTVARAPILS